MHKMHRFARALSELFLAALSNNFFGMRSPDVALWTCEVLLAQEFTAGRPACRTQRGSPGRSLTDGSEKHSDAAIAGTKSSR